MCRCDMFPAEHPDGYVDEATGTYCELVLRPGPPGVPSIAEPRISPHLFPGTVPTEPEPE